MVRDIVVSMLRTIGFRQVRHAADGQSGLRIAMDELPHLILCDITMERMDGFQFVENMHKAGFHDGKHIPTIFLTSHATSEFVVRARQLGVDAYVVKPVKKDVLEARIRHALSQRPADLR